MRRLSVIKVITVLVSSMGTKLNCTCVSAPRWRPAPVHGCPSLQCCTRDHRRLVVQSSRYNSHWCSCLSLPCILLLPCNVSVELHKPCIALTPAHPVGLDRATQQIQSAEQLVLRSAGNNRANTEQHNPANNQCRRLCEQCSNQRLTGPPHTRLLARMIHCQLDQ